MKLRHILWVTAIVLFVGAIAIFLRKEFTGPMEAFRRHFGNPVPASVRDVSVSGYTALAGSDETLVFQIESRETLI